jgi:predicted ATPase
MFNVSTQIIDNHLSEYGWEDLHRKSHGEAFLWLMQNRFRGNGLYVLDEPEAALSPQRQLALLRIIHDLVRQGSQFIIATHSPILMAYPNSTCYLLDQQGVSSTTLEETEHFQVTRDFVNNPQRMLHYLFEE